MCDPVGTSAHIKVVGMMLCLHNRRLTVLISQDSITNLTHNLKHPVDMFLNYKHTTSFPTHHNLRGKSVLGSLTSTKIDPWNPVIVPLHPYREKNQRRFNSIPQSKNSNGQEKCHCTPSTLPVYITSVLAH